jgi:hypothetical protein
VAGACPLDEVAHGSAGRRALGEPLIEVCLSEGDQGLVAVVQPGQQVKRGQDAGTSEVRRSPAVDPVGSGPAGAAENGPVREGPDQAGMAEGLVQEQVFQPRRQALSRCSLRAGRTPALTSTSLM